MSALFQILTQLRSKPTFGPSNMPPIYSPLPTEEPDKQSDLEAAAAPRSHRATLKKGVFHILAIAAIMYALVLAAKEIPSVCRMARNKGFLPKNGAYVHPKYNTTGCRGNRTMVTTSGLPSFYTLPSGDKIPSVALGKCYVCET